MTPGCLVMTRMNAVRIFRLPLQALGYIENFQILTSHLQYTVQYLMHSNRGVTTIGCQNHMP